MSMLFLLATLAAGQPTDETARPLAQAFVAVTQTSCARIQEGTAGLPDPADREALTKRIAAIEAMGLAFGLSSRIMADLGPEGQFVVNRSTMAAKALPGGDAVVTFEGPTPGCRVLLLSDHAEMGDAVAAELTRVGWREAPTSLPQSTAATRRMFVRRDAKGHAHLNNLITLAAPHGKLRLYTTMIRIPDHVVLPAGF